MKRIQLFASIAFALTLFSLVSCKKDPVDDLNPDNQRATYAHVNFMRGYGFSPEGCVPTPSFCADEILLTAEQFKNTKPGTNEFFAKPEAVEIRSQGVALRLTGEMEVSQLDEEARHQLFTENRLLFEYETPIKESIVRQAYENAGLDYDGTQFSIKPGAYKVEHIGGSGTGELPAKIVIIITISKDGVTITIKWE